MKLYFIRYNDPELERDGVDHRCVLWCGTQAEQKKEAKRLKSEMFEDIRPGQEDVPTSKAQLIQFLNHRQVQP